MSVTGTDFVFFPKDSDNNNLKNYDYFYTWATATHITSYTAAMNHNKESNDNFENDDDFFSNISNNNNNNNNNNNDNDLLII